MVKPFIDTNVLVYAFSDDQSRRTQAAALVAYGGVVSVQILNEFVNVARRKLGKTWPTIVRALDDLATVLDPPVALTFEMHRDAVAMSRRYGFRIYDSLVLSAAKRAGCLVVYTEDLQDGQVIEGVSVRNPFAGGPASLGPIGRARGQEN